MDKDKMMKIFLFKLLVLFLIVFQLVSCFDPIFYMVTVETPMLDPLIGGSPTNFTEYKNELYIASGKKIFSYGKNIESGNNEWKTWIDLDAFVLNLASTGSSLYALYISEDSGKIRRYYDNNDPSKSEDVDLPGNIQSIHASDDYLFACARDNDNNYTVYYRKEGDAGFSEILMEKPDSKPLDYMLIGAASDGIYLYLCAYSGIFYVEIVNIASSSALPLKDSEDKIITGFTGIINLNPNCIAAICHNGDLYEITNAAISEKTAAFEDSRYATGALAIWKDKDDPTTPVLLLVGRNEDYYSTTSAYSNGYVEIELEASGNIKTDAKFKEPGKDAPTSIDDYDRYAPSLGKKLINYIIQTPAGIDVNMTMFAATQQDGVWSYRDHGEGITWNSEQ